MDVPFFLAIGIFLVTYAAILSERVHKTVAAIAGGCAMILFHVVSEEAAFKAVDLSVLFLLTGMMIITHFLAVSGFFNYGAVRLAQLARGRPILLLIFLCAMTGVLSAMVDNVTTMLLVAPVTLLIAEAIEVRPTPYLVFEVMAANIGGVATLVGDPPNILIGSKADLGFNQFLIHLGPVALLCLAVLLAGAVLSLGKRQYVPLEVRARVMEMNARGAISNPRLLTMSCTVLGVVFVAFLLHDAVGIPPATVALCGAAALLLLTKSDPATAFNAVEWTTLFFFIGLFIVVEGLVEAGVVACLAQGILAVMGHSLFLAAMVMLWFSGVASALMGAVPTVTVLIPLVQRMIPAMEQGASQPTMVSHALWWSLALGVGLGGNATIISAAANVVVVDIARKNHREISFLHFMKYGVPTTLASLFVAAIYICLRYVF